MAVLLNLGQHQWSLAACTNVNKWLLFAKRHESEEADWEKIRFLEKNKEGSIAKST